LEGGIARLEFSSLTGCETDNSIGLSDVYIDSSRPAYIEACTAVYFVEDGLDMIYKDIESMKYKLDNYRVRFLNTLVHVEFDARKCIERHISDIFEGCPNLKNPVDDFIITYTGTKWIFGKLAWETKNRWLIYNKKPYTFCSSLPARMARALVNIAVQGHNQRASARCGTPGIQGRASTANWSDHPCRNHAGNAGSERYGNPPNARLSNSGRWPATARWPVPAIRGDSAGNRAGGQSACGNAAGASHHARSSARSGRQGVSGRQQQAGRSGFRGQGPEGGHDISRRRPDAGLPRVAAGSVPHNAGSK
jgi:hypothetical protein